MTDMENSTPVVRWYTVVAFGTTYRGPSGPWPSREAAEKAVERYRDKVGAGFGSEWDSANARIAGPFASRFVACNVDISDYTRFLKEE
jgi:hypothetical protein